MGRQVGDRAIVLGGGIAGLLAATVLAEAFSQVLVVDRDELDGVAGARRGVPHGRHAHGLVARGQQVFEELYPGLTEELRTAGVRSGDFSSAIRWYFNGYRLASGQSGLLSVPATRPVLEHHVRRRVQAMPRVSFLERYDILGLETDADRRRVTGARVQRQDGGTVEVLPADLVVDITGRGSRTPVWLEELGYERPEETRIKIDLAYTTRHFQLDCDPFGDELAIIPVATPAHPRGAFFYRLPGDDRQVQLSLTSILGDHPPADLDGFLAYARSLPVPDIYDAVRRATPTLDSGTFKFPASVRRHYERLTRFPENLLVMGDAVCSFNPVYGQGMTVAALEALALRRQLRLGALPNARRFFQEVGAAVDAPWDFAAGADLGYRGVEGRRTPRIRLANAYVNRLHQGATHDSELTAAFIRAAGLIDTPASLMRPRTLLRVLRNSFRGPTGAAAIAGGLPPRTVRRPS